MLLRETESVVVKEQAIQLAEVLNSVLMSFPVELAKSRPLSVCCFNEPPVPRCIERTVSAE